MATLTSVLTVGAGPAGLTAAAHLHRHGVTCRIVDRSPGPTETSKALVLWPRSLETLDDLGIVGQFLNAGMFANAARVHGGGRLLVRPDGYLGKRSFSFRSRAEWWEDLRRHLDRYLIA